MRNETPIEYKMNKALFNAILANKKNKKDNPYQYVMAVLNESFGLRGTVKRLHII